MPILPYFENRPEQPLSLIILTGNYPERRFSESRVNFGLPASMSVQKSLMGVSLPQA
jgi:hypothetical protein